MRAPTALNRSTALVVLFLCGSVSAATVLEPVVVEGSTADTLLNGTIGTSLSGDVSPTQASGSMIRDLETTLPVPVTDYGTPGSTTQLRGLGRTVEDTNVQTLGVPLNPAQGGGFDFSTFPQFFWTSYSYYIGPSTGAFDPRASAGTLSLVPWTASQLGLGKSEPRFRLTETVTRGLNQFSAAGSYHELAALVGVSSINAKGPTGSVSDELYRSETFDIRAHFLATSLDVTSPGSTSFPTPNARLKTNRMIPVLEANVSPSSDVLLKQSLFYDRSSLRFVNPDSAVFDSFDRTEQLGSESVVLYRDWTFALSLRRTSFTQVGGEAPHEGIGHSEVQKNFSEGPWTLQTSVQSDWVNLYGFRPGGSIGERYSYLKNADAFARTSYTFRFPTLQDRFYQGQGFVANPNLPLEKVLSQTFGNEWKAASFAGEIEGKEQILFEQRWDAQLFNAGLGVSGGVVDGGRTEAISYLDQHLWHLNSQLALDNRLRLSGSHVDSSASRIPYDPLVTESLGARFQNRAERPRYQGGVSLRTQSHSPSGLGPEAPGFFFMDLDAGYDLWRPDQQESSLTVVGRVDNVFNRPIQLVYGYPWPGRLFSLSLLARL